MILISGAAGHTCCKIRSMYIPALYDSLRRRLAYLYLLRRLGCFTWMMYFGIFHIVETLVTSSPAFHALKLRARSDLKI